MSASTAATPDRWTRRANCCSASRPTPRALSSVEQTLILPGIGLAAWAPGNLHISFGIRRDPTRPLDPRLVEQHKRVRDACKTRGIPFLGAPPRWT